MQIEIYRNAAVNESISIDDSSRSVHTLNGEDYCNLKFESKIEVDIQIGDYIVIQGRTYTLNILPSLKKISSVHYSYDCQFESVMYQLRKARYSDGVNMEFDLTGDLAFFAANIITNINRIQSGWSLGTVTTGTETKTLTFSNENCLQVLQRLCTEYKLDFVANEDKSIDIGSFGAVLTQTFKYGRGNGLYNLERKNVDSKDMFTRLYPFGSDRNIPANYRNYSKRLKLGTDYIEKNVATYGVIEASYMFDDIYPRFKGSVTYVGVNNVFRCSTMDFDLNSYLASGTSAKIHFNTGALAGYEFELVSYTHSTKEFTLKYSEQEKTFDEGTLSPFILPNDTIKPGLTDQFVLLDITMPDSYITAAEATLLAEATTYLNQNSDPRVSYTLELDPLFMLQNGYNIHPGDYLPVYDLELGIDRLIQVLSVEKSIYEPVKWKLDLSDYTAPRIIDSMQADIEDVKRLIVVNKLSDIAKAKRNWKTAVELRDSIFDPDGYFDNENIKPLSIETALLSVGTRAGNLTLSCAVEPNYGRDPSQVRFGAGTLVHFQIETTIRTWTITENIQTGLITGTTYYIYARCARSGSGGILLADTVQRLVDSDPTYYYFPIGILSSVIDGWRDALMTFGQSYLVGRTLNVGKITGVNGLEINLDTGDITGRVTFSNGLTEGDIQDAIDGSLDIEASMLTPIERSDVIAHYAFDESTGIKMYDSLGGYNGIVNNTRTFETGIINNCLVTGVNNAYGAIDEAMISQSFSVALWLNGQVNWNVGSDIIRSAEANGFRISTSAGGRTITVRVRNYSNVETTITSYTPSDIDIWHHLAFTYNGVSGAWVLYWDGVSVDSGTNLVTRAADYIDCFLGWNQSTSYLICRMDELYICSNVLTDKKVRYLFYQRDAFLRKSTQVVIDSGVVTAGTIQLGDGAMVKAGITGAGTSEEEVRGWAGATFANRANAPFKYLQNGKVYATAGDIGGWHIDTDALYSGTKSTANGFSANGITLAANGGIHSERFYINSDGTIGFRSGTSNKRVEINSVNNRIDILNSFGQQTVTIDDTLGGNLANPGIRVFDPADLNDYSQLGKYGMNVVLNDSTNAIEVRYYNNISHVKFLNLPTSATGLTSGEAFVDSNNFLRIVP